MRSRSLFIFSVVCASGLLLASPASAVIMVLTPLKVILEKEEFIFVAKVQDTLPDKPAMVLVVDENLKGKAPFERFETLHDVVAGLEARLR